ncbi:MAG: YajQ family cyclic di-GMP-binding protein [Deltaproteobacteria bacterium CG_4_10_14_0_2_um_filter_43_8]|nr:MAG: YajQ family cyclic di-GMP-binding protein [Deltaproteobacteria bacterium CG_4_10_14_0_2_um_filter_43_8]
MPSFDIVNKVDLQEMDNAVNNSIKEVATRFDFRNSRTTIEFNKKDKVINIVTADKMNMDTLEDMVTTHCIRRKVNPKCLEFKDFEPTGQNLLKRVVKIKEGIEMETAHKIVKLIKGLNLKVQASIQDEQVRVTGKKIDDLQSVIQALNAQDLGIPLQYVNMKA